MSACYCCRPDRNCEKCRARTETYKLGGGGVAELTVKLDLSQTPAYARAICLLAECRKAVELWYRLGGRSAMFVADGYQGMADAFSDDMVELHTALKEHMRD